MKLSKKDVLHVAKLAKLSLSDDEQEKFGSQLSEVIHYVSELDEVDTKGAEATSQTTGLTNVFREDSQKEESLSKDAALSGTEKIHNDYFVVPQLVSKEE